MSPCLKHSIEPSLALGVTIPRFQLIETSAQFGGVDFDHGYSRICA
jgi:hypothetical protein